MADGVSHAAGDPIVAPYNLYILEGKTAGAPESYMLTENVWEYRNYVTGQLQDVSILLWKFNQGSLGLNPYTVLNKLFSSKLRANV